MTEGGAMTEGTEGGGMDDGRLLEVRVQPPASTQPPVAGALLDSPAPIADARPGRRPDLARRGRLTPPAPMPNDIQLSDDDLREITRYAADCAERALALFEAEHPTDARPRDAIDGARAFARGGRRIAALRAQAWAAYAAARTAENPAAADAAHAAQHAAAAAYLHPRASAHQVKHVLGAAVHQARARERAADGDEDVGAENLRWAIGHASPTVRDVVRRLPAVTAGRGRLGDLFRQLDAALRR